MAMAAAAAAAARPGAVAEAAAAAAVAAAAWGLLGWPVSADDAALTGATGAAVDDDTDDVGDDPSDAELPLDIGGEKAVAFSVTITSR